MVKVTRMKPICGGDPLGNIIDSLFGEINQLGGQRTLRRYWTCHLGVHWTLFILVIGKKQHEPSSSITKSARV